ncbi:TOTE conflict system archaeo-eukaryotic primase domain-containing protein [Thermanaerosceptrum fracticalcis]|uniref:TOTE conflict system archaeo-eukaryotic primase domain-containing protein n=1 Tax=Thermanaerosceptrum fracticalcis TaxID=1712410 RepID=UPI003B82FFDA
MKLNLLHTTACFQKNQDTLPKGGLGNLIALPLQLNARRNKNSVFIDAISNFIIKPIEIIEAEEEAQVSAEVINDRGESFRRTFLTTEFGNLQKFKNVLNQNTPS